MELCSKFFVAFFLPVKNNLKLIFQVKNYQHADLFKKLFDFKS